MICYQMVLFSKSVPSAVSIACWQIRQSRTLAPRISCSVVPMAPSQPIRFYLYKALRMPFSG